MRKLVIALWLVLPAAAPSADRPNIILLMGDDHGWEETGYNGHPWLQTPVLDEMAATALRFDRFYAAHSSCSPTRGSILTGRHPNRYGTFSPNWSTRPEEITITQKLRHAGYATGHFGKWHVGPVKAGSPTNPGAMGFDEWLSHDNFFEMSPSLSRNGGAPRIYEGESSTVVIDEAIDFIRRSKRSGKPFFTVVWFGSPHEPYSGLKRDLALYDNLPEMFSDELVELTSHETGLPIRRPLGDVLRERYAEITAMDRAIGSLRSFLSKEGLSENTLVWYIGDNGTPAHAVAKTPLRGAKATFYEEGIRVPGIIEWPARITESRESDLPAVTSDIFPTLCALVGESLPDHPMDGVNLVPLIDGTMNARSKPIYFWSYNIGALPGRGLEPYIDPEHQSGTTPLVKIMNGVLTRNFQNLRFPTIQERDYEGARVVLDGDYKLVVDGSEGASTELFNLRDDLSETTNLAERQPERVETMKRALRAWQDSVLASLTGADYR